MTTEQAAATPTQSTGGKKGGKQNFDPEEYRMSVGDHLEELRARLILSLIGFVLAAVVCFIFGEEVISIFCRPLIESQMKAHLSPQVYYTEAQEAFMVYIQISLISAATLASPWMLYQLWQFVAAGLYPEERKYITRYLPLSIVLLVVGMLFLYYYVLPVSIEFFFHFGSGIPLHMPKAHVDPSMIPATQPVFEVPRYDGNPPNPQQFQMWLDLGQRRLKMFLDGQVRVIPFGPENLAAPMITLSKYINMVVGMLLAFGISFQLPLVVLALVKVGIVEIPMLKAMRRYVYFAMSIVAAIIIPDVVTGMIALMVPLILLYELGIFLAWWGERRKPKEE